jgi:hypothetical protein
MNQGPRCTCRGKISASALETARGCLRKWAWTAIAGLPRTSTPAAEEGTRIHAVLEEYLTTGRTDLHSREGRILTPALAYLPRYGEASPEVHWTTLDGQFHGFIDAEAPGRLWDLKTTGNLLYAKTPETLRTDVQALLYAHSHLERHDVPEVRATWVYTRRTPERPSALPVDTTFRRDDVAAAVESIRTDAERLVQLRRDKTDPMGLAPNPEECSRYGGCPYQDHCTDLTPERRRMAFMGIQDQLQKLRGVNPPAPAAANLTIPPGQGPEGFVWIPKADGSGWGIQPQGALPEAPAGHLWEHKTDPGTGPYVIAVPLPPPAPPPADEAPAAKRGPGRPRKVTATEGAAPATGTSDGPSTADGWELVFNGLRMVIDGAEILVVRVTS